MKKISKRILSLVLVVLILMTSLPAGLIISASKDDIGGENINVVEELEKESDLNEGLEREDDSSEELEELKLEDSIKEELNLSEKLDSDEEKKESISTTRILEDESEIDDWIYNKVYDIGDTYFDGGRFTKDWWEISAMSRIGYYPEEDTIEWLEYERAEKVDNANETLKDILAFRSLEYDPENINGRNFIWELLYHDDVRPFYYEANGLWALFSDDYETVRNNMHRIDNMVENLLTHQIEEEDVTGEKPWDITKDQVGYFKAHMEVDDTGFALYALAPFYNGLVEGSKFNKGAERGEEVQEAVNKALERISLEQDETGDIYGKLHGANSNSLSMIIFGISELDPDLIWDSRFIKNGNTFLHALKNKYSSWDDFGNSIFQWHQGNDYGGIEMATEQGFRAIINYKLNSNEENGVFKYNDFEKEPLGYEDVKIYKDKLAELTMEVSSSENDFENKYENYEEESVKKLKDMWLRSIDILDDMNVEQSDIDSAYFDLLKSIDNLKKQSEQEEENETLIQEINNRISKLPNPEEINFLEKDNIEDIRNLIDSNLLEEKIENIAKLKDIEDILKNMEDTIVELEKEIKKADNLIKENEYTDETLEDLISNIEVAKNLLDNGNFNLKEIKSNLTEVKRAKKGLMIKPIKVKIKIEKNDSTIVPERYITLDRDKIEPLFEKAGYDKLEKNTWYRPLEAIMLALDEAGFDVSNGEHFYAEPNGTFITVIDGLEMNSINPGMDGWMYWVNNDWANLGVREFEIKDGDTVDVLFKEHYLNTAYSWFQIIQNGKKLNKTNDLIDIDETSKLYLQYNHYNEEESIPDAKILIKEEFEDGTFSEEKEMVIDGEVVKTDSNGEVELSFEKPGVYNISAEKKNDEGVRVISRPFARIRVFDKSRLETAVNKAKSINKEDHTEETVKELESIKLEAEKLLEDIDNMYSTKIYDDNINQSRIDEKASLLEDAYESLDLKGVESTNREDVEAAIDNLLYRLLDNHHSMDWVSLGLARSNNKDLIPSDYIDNVIKYIEKNEGEFAPRWTEYQRMAIGITAAGGDPRDVGGYDLVAKSSNGDLDKQGINALAFGLITLDLKDYDDSEFKWNRDRIVEAILDDECTNEGTDYGKPAGWIWEALEKADADMTGMVITSLAPYYKGDKQLGHSEKYGDLNQAVKEAVDRAIDWISWTQLEDGTMPTWGNSTSESTVQTIVGLAANDIDPTSKDFTKSGGNLIDGLLSFEVEDGGFAHIREKNGELRYNGMATEQALYGLAQYINYLDGKGSIYDFTDSVKDNDFDYNINLLDKNTVYGEKLNFRIESSEENILKKVYVNGDEVDIVDSKDIEVILDEGKNEIKIKLINNDIEKEEKYTIYYHKQNVVIEENDIEIESKVIKLPINRKDGDVKPLRLLLGEYSKEDNRLIRVYEEELTDQDLISIELLEELNKNNFYRLMVWDENMSPQLDIIDIGK